MSRAAPASAESSAAPASDAALIRGQNALVASAASIAENMEVMTAAHPRRYQARFAAVRLDLAEAARVFSSRPAGGRAQLLAEALAGMLGVCAMFEELRSGRTRLAGPDDDVAATLVFEDQVLRLVRALSAGLSSYAAALAPASATAAHERADLPVAPPPPPAPKPLEQADALAAPKPLELADALAAPKPLELAAAALAAPGGEGRPRRVQFAEAPLAAAGRPLTDEELARRYQAQYDEDYRRELDASRLQADAPPAAAASAPPAAAARGLSAAAARGQQLRSLAADAAMAAFIDDLEGGAPPGQPRA